VPSLRDAQSRFKSSLLAPGGPPGLRIYRANVFGNWSQALAGAYPIVRKIVGADFFEGLASAYARAHPSAGGDLNEYGARCADFIAVFPHTADLPYLPDVARLEWLAHRAYYAADPVTFSFQGLCESTRLRLAPACALLASDWPLARIWTVHQDDYEGGFDIDLAAGPDRILIHRPAWRAQIRSLAPGDYRFLQCAARGATLYEALEAAATEDEGFDASLALACWVDAGAITL
jgi:uncharacterized protein